MDTIGLQTLSVQLISNGKVKTKLAILSFLYFGEFVKNSCGKNKYEEGMNKRDTNSPANENPRRSEIDKDYFTKMSEKNSLNLILKFLH